MQVLSLGWEDPLEERMATHFSILVYRILMDKGAWWATVHRVTKSRTQLKQLSMYPCTVYVYTQDGVEEILQSSRNILIVRSTR